MEEQHPIPQQISSYQFHLVGDMTLKQFFQIAGGSVISLLIYSTSLHPFIKWPLVFFSFIMGIALAFLPLQDRPLEVWILSFFRSIYSPTVYKWDKSKTNAQPFQPETTPSVAPLPQQTPVVLPQPAILPVVSQPTPLTVNPPIPPAPPVNNIPKENPILPQPPFKNSPVVNLPHPAVIQEIKKVDVPTNTAPVIGNTIKNLPSRPEEIVSAKENNDEYYSPAAKQSIVGAQQAQFSQSSSLPMPPTKANVIVGQVLGANGEIVENAILEVKDAEGRSVRALRSNKLGHFMIITPLTDGKYEIITEKEGLQFGPITFEANGQIIPPISIAANNKPEGIKAEAVPTMQAPALGGDVYKTI